MYITDIESDCKGNPLQTDINALQAECLSLIAEKSDAPGKERVGRRRD